MINAVLIAVTIMIIVTVVSLRLVSAEQNDSGFFRSTKTDTYDISTSFDDSWYSSSGTPMDLYFFDNETELTATTCGLSLNDGQCDPSFNKVEYQFDGGDCCAATCTHPSCGIGGLTSVFGNESNSGDGFSDCKDPAMVPITIRFDNIFGSNIA